MKPRELWGHFDWVKGSCFRCEEQETEVAVIGEIGARGIDVTISACRTCVFRLEQLHWTLAERQHRARLVAPNVEVPARLNADGSRVRPARTSRSGVARWTMTFRLSRTRSSTPGQHRRT